MFIPRVFGLFGVSGLYAGHIERERERERERESSTAYNKYKSYYYYYVTTF